MSMWGAAPLLAAALVGAGTHQAIVHQPGHPGYVAAAFAGLQPGPAAASSPPSLASTTPVLSQAGGTWTTTVLVTGAGKKCPTSDGDYLLDTTSPAMSLAPTGKISPVSFTGTGSFSGSCQVALTFKGLTQVPASATLVIEGSSALALAVSRSTGLFFYLGVPAISAGSMALLLLLFTLAFVRVYDRYRNRQYPWPFATTIRTGKRIRRWRFVGTGFWTHEVYASGAWTLNDSWATNITVAVAVVTPILTLIPATDLLFRGVALDRFAVLSAVAAGMAAAAPLYLAVRYYRWFHHHPGVTDDATLTMATPWPDWRAVDEGTSVTLPAGTLAVLPAGASLNIAHPQGVTPKQPSPGPIRAELRAAREVKLATNTTVTPAVRRWVRLPPTRVRLDQGTEVTLSDGQQASLTEECDADLPVGGAAKIAADQDSQEASLLVHQDKLLEDDYSGPAAGIRAPSGATVTVPWGAVVCHSRGDDQAQTAYVEADGKIRLPPGSAIRVLAHEITLPGGSDVIVRGASAIYVLNLHETLTIAADNVSAPHDHPSDDIVLPFPVWIAAPSGAKITADGVAQLTVPDTTTVTAPHRDPFTLSPVRTHARLPQGSNSLAGTLGMVIAAALITMFGIGAQIGIAAVLARLSEADLAGCSIIWAVLGLLAIGTLRYSVTAISMTADPQPGSSMSSAAGTSFTL